MANSLIKTRNRFEFSNFKGVDTSSAPTAVARNRAVYMRNIIDRDGTPHNRHGWTDQELSLDGTIYGKHEAVLDGMYIKFLHCKDKLYLLSNGKYVECSGNVSFDINETNDGLVKATESSNTNHIGAVSETKSTMYFSNEKCYFVGLGRYAVFGKWSNGKYELRQVKNNEDTYIPMILTNIDDSTISSDQREALEDINLMSDYVKYGLVGRNIESTDRVYNLNQAIKIDDNFNVKLTTLNKFGKEDIRNFKASSSAQIEPVGNEETRKCILDGEKIIKISSSGTVYKAQNLRISLSGNVRRDFLSGGNTSIFYGKNDNGNVVFRVYYEKISGTDDYNIMYSGNLYSGIIGKATYHKFIASIWFSLSSNDNILQANADLQNNFNTNVTYYTGGDYYFLAEYGALLYGQKIKFEETYPLIEKDTTVGSVQANGTISFGTNVGQLIYSSNIAPNTNIEVTCCPIFDNESNNQPFTNEFIDSSNISALFGGDGNCDRIFFANNINPNVIFWTEFNDNYAILQNNNIVPFTYISDLSYTTIGTGTNSITGMYNLNDSSLAVFKNNSINENNFYILKAETLINESETKTQFKVTNSTANMSQTAINNNCFGSLESSILFASKDGVFAISVTNANNPQRYALERSMPIRNLFKDCDMLNAKAIVWDNKYMLAVKYKKGTPQEEDLVMIADAKYKYYLDRNVNNTYNYEWYIFTHCPVQQWTIEYDSEGNQKLGFYNYSGKLCLFNEEYRDIEFYKKGAIVKRDDNTYVMSDENFNLLNNSDKYAVKITNATYKETGKDFGNEILYLKNGKFALDIDSEETFDLVFSVDTDMKIYEITNVNAVWFTPVCDFGASDYVKTLFMLTLGIDSETSSSAVMGYKTRYNPSEAKVSIDKFKAGGQFDFDKMDFELVSFGEAFASSFTRKIKLRNFTYIQFFFGCNKNRDFSFNNLTLLYKFNKFNKGVY